MAVTMLLEAMLGTTMTHTVLQQLGPMSQQAYLFASLPTPTRKMKNVLTCGGASVGGASIEVNLRHYILVCALKSLICHGSVVTVCGV